MRETQITGRFENNFVLQSNSSCNVAFNTRKLNVS